MRTAAECLLPKVSNTPFHVTLKSLSVLALLVLFFLRSSAQSSQAQSWTYDTAVNGVQFYHAIVACGGKNVVLLKMNNANNRKVEVSWKEMFKTQVKEEREGALGRKKIILTGGETFASDCTEKANRSLLIMPLDVSAAYAVNIQGFEFKDISVSPIQ